MNSFRSPQTRCPNNTIIIAYQPHNIHTQPNSITPKSTGAPAIKLETQERRREEIKKKKP